MGIIKKQSIQGTIYSYIGVVLGFITTGILFPRVLSTDEVGLLRLLVSVSILFSQFAGLGFNTVAVRNFPFFRNADKGHHGFLRLSLLVSLAGFVLSMIVFFLMKPWLIKENIEKSALFIDYILYLIPLIFFSTFFNILDTYYRVLYNAIKGLIYKEIWQRFFILAAILAYFFTWLSFHQLVVVYVIALSFPAVMITFSLIIKGNFHLGRDKGFISKKLARQMTSVAFFGIITSYSGVLIMNIDVVMINHALGLADTGIYALSFYFGTLVLIPSRPVIKIASVMLADGFKENNLKKIADIYYKSNITLCTIGLMLFLGLLINIDNIITILGPDYEAGKYVVVFIGLANFFEMSTSVSQNVITNSPHYKVITWLMLLFVGLLIVTNLFFIPRFGIVGAAFASAFSRFIFNLLSWLFLVRKYHLQPFNIKYLILLSVGLGSFLVAWLMPEMSWFGWDIIIRSTLFSLLFGVFIYYLKVSDDINQSIDTVFRKIGLMK